MQRAFSVVIKMFVLVTKWLCMSMNEERSCSRLCLTFFVLQVLFLLRCGREGEFTETEADRHSNSLFSSLFTGLTSRYIF